MAEYPWWALDVTGELTCCWCNCQQNNKFVMGVKTKLTQNLMTALLHDLSLLLHWALFSEFYSRPTSLICYLIVKRICMYSAVCNRKSVYFIKLQYNLSCNLIDFAGFAVKGRNSNSWDEGATTGVRLCKTTRWVDINPQGWAKGQITLTDNAFYWINIKC